MLGTHTACLPASVTGSIYAVVPRFASFHAPHVTFDGTFHLHPASGDPDLVGDGRLIPTREAPVRARLRFSGTANLRTNAGQPCGAKHLSANLTLQLDVSASAG